MKRRSFKRKICPAFEVGRCGGCRRFYIEISFSGNKELSMCGVFHGSGQNYDELTNENLIPNDGFEYADLLKIQNIWKRWHLNHLRAGTPKQEEFVRAWINGKSYDYKEICEALNEVGLLIDNGYRYGTSWLKEDVPTDVIRYLFSLPAISGDSWGDISPEPISEQDFLKVIGLL